MARRLAVVPELACGPWSSRDGSPRRERRAPRHRRCRRRRAALLRGAARRRAPGAGELAARGAGGDSRSRSRCPPGLAFAQALHACLLLGAIAVPVDLRSSPPSASSSPRCGGARRGASGHDPVRARVRRSPARHDLDATAVVIHTSGTTASPRPVELTYGNFLWSALGSAVALGLDPASAGCARCRCRTSAGSRSSCARPSTPRRRSCTSASRSTACCTPCASRTSRS
jgi:acyl-CoA synthetase (AMP-forming)/AMP-acid ligase II